MEVNIREKIISNIQSTDLTKSEFKIKNPSLIDIKKALDELSKENHEYEYIESHPQILIDRLIKIQPDLELKQEIDLERNKEPEPKKESKHSSNKFGISMLFLAILALGIFVFYDKFYKEHLEDQGELKEIRLKLKDPSSAKFKDIKKQGSTICGMVLAKNSYGANTGYKKFYYVKSVGNLEGILHMEGSEIFDMTYKIYCN